MSKGQVFNPIEKGRIREEFLQFSNKEVDLPNADELGPKECERLRLRVALYRGALKRMLDQFELHSPEELSRIQARLSVQQWREMQLRLQRERPGVIQHARRCSAALSGVLFPENAHEKGVQVPFHFTGNRLGIAENIQDANWLVAGEPNPRDAKNLGSFSVRDTVATIYDLEQGDLSKTRIQELIGVTGPRFRRNQRGSRLKLNPEEVAGIFRIRRDFIVNPESLYGEFLPLRNYLNLLKATDALVKGMGKKWRDLLPDNDANTVANILYQMRNGNRTKLKRVNRNIVGSVANIRGTLLAELEQRRREIDDLYALQAKVYSE